MGGLKARTQALKVLKRSSLDNPLPAATTPPSPGLTLWFRWDLSAPSHCPWAQRQILAGAHLASPLPISESGVPTSPGFLQLLVFHPGSTLLLLLQPPDSSLNTRPQATENEEMKSLWIHRQGKEGTALSTTNAPALTWRTALTLAKWTNRSQISSWCRPVVKENKPSTKQENECWEVINSTSTIWINAKQSSLELVLQSRKSRS